VPAVCIPASGMTFGNRVSKTMHPGETSFSLSPNNYSNLGICFRLKADHSRGAPPGSLSWPNNPWRDQHVRSNSLTGQSYARVSR
jgi:hypothetical protein